MPIDLEKAEADSGDTPLSGDSSAIPAMDAAQLMEFLYRLLENYSPQSHHGLLIRLSYERLLDHYPKALATFLTSLKNTPKLGEYLAASLTPALIEQTLLFLLPGDEVQLRRFKALIHMALLEDTFSSSVLTEKKIMEIFFSSIIYTYKPGTNFTPQGFVSSVLSSIQDVDHNLHMSHELYLLAKLKNTGLPPSWLQALKNDAGNIDEDEKKRIIFFLQDKKAAAPPGKRMTLFAILIRWLRSSPQEARQCIITTHNPTLIRKWAQLLPESLLYHLAWLLAAPRLRKLPELCDTLLHGWARITKTVNKTDLLKEVKWEGILEYLLTQGKRGVSRKEFVTFFIAHLISKAKQKDDNTAFSGVIGGNKRI